MTWVDTTITEGDLQNDLNNLLTGAGWALAGHFKKVVFGNNFINEDANLYDTAQIGIGVAEHFIYRNSLGALYGLALYGEFTEYYGVIPSAARPAPGMTSFSAFAAWATNRYPKYKSCATVYTYMCEKLPTEATSGADIVLATDQSLLRSALDIEVWEGKYIRNEITNKNVYSYTTTYPDIMQSPLVYAGLRMKYLEKDGTNWWPDSQIQVRGQINDKTLFVILQADNACAFEYNMVPSVPLYWGQIQSFMEDDTGGNALFAGSCFNPKSFSTLAQAKKDSAAFDYDGTIPYIPDTVYGVTGAGADAALKNIMPLLKNYPSRPGVGIDTIIVNRSKYGSRYQANYLSWNTVPGMIPPIKQGPTVDPTNPNSTITAKYNKAWQRIGSPVYSYQFNPSRYSEKVHTSRAYVIHPEEGVRGYLPDAIVLSGMSLIDGDKLRVKRQACPQGLNDIYRFFLTSAISPLTKRPGTPYRPVGIGILQGEEGAV